MAEEYKLNPKQRAFADYYIECGVAEEAARKAGYSEKYARGKAYTLLANVGIKSYIEERMKPKENRRIASADEVLEFLTRGMYQELEEDVVVTEGCGQGITESRIIKKKNDSRTAAKCAEMLAKRYAIFKDKLEVDAEVGIKIVDDID
ncbi:MAG: terminase small subunit [Lachnospira sp.]